MLLCVLLPSFGVITLNSKWTGERDLFMFFSMYNYFFFFSFEGNDINLSRELCVGSCQRAHSTVRKGARQVFVSLLGTTSLRALMETQLLSVWNNGRDRGAAGCWLMSCWVVLDACESAAHPWEWEISRSAAICTPLTPPYLISKLSAV